MQNHVNSGIRKILENPKIYNLFHDILGGNNFRKNYFETNFNLPKGAKILDIGCGSAVMLKYINQEIDYYGIDFEESYIEYCRKTYGNRGNFFLEKAGEKLREDWFGYFDAINAHGLLHHISDAEGELVLETGLKYLKSGGFLVTFDTATHQNQSTLAKAFINMDRGKNIKTPEEYLNMAKKYFKNVNGKLYENYSRIPYSAYSMVMTK